MFVVKKSFKEFKEYRKITFPNMSVGQFYFRYISFFVIDILHENSGLVVKLVKYFGEPMDIKTLFSNIN